MQAALSASLATQRALGVPDDAARVLTNNQVASAVHTLTTTPVAQANMGQALDAMREQYGDHWNRAMSELVRYGKLPGPFQVVASMTEPGQMAARQDLIRAAQQDAERGGAKRLTDIVPLDEKKTIDRDLDGYIDPFRQTAAVAGNTANTDLIANVKDSVRTLAYLYAAQGKSGDQALQAAADGILHQKYDFSGTLRAPVGHMSDAENMTLDVQRSLTSDQLAYPDGDPNLTPEQRRDIVFKGATRNGVWVPNPTDDGADLMAPVNGGMVRVFKKDGAPVSVKWPKNGGPWPARPGLQFEPNLQ